MGAILRLPVEVKFDPENVEHVQAFVSLIAEGKQHETLRFQLEYPFATIREMAFHKVTFQYAKSLGLETLEVKNFAYDYA